MEQTAMTALQLSSLLEALINGEVPPVQVILLLYAAAILYAAIHLLFCQYALCDVQINVFVDVHGIQFLRIVAQIYKLLDSAF